jgi:hypothetical protein
VLVSVSARSHGSLRLYDHSVAPPSPPRTPVQEAAGATIAASVAALMAASPALAFDFPKPPQFDQAKEQAAEVKDQAAQSLNFGDNKEAPPVKADGSLPEGNNWRYSDFINAVTKGKVERVRFSKDGGQLQLTATDGRRAQVRGRAALSSCTAAARALHWCCTCVLARG